VGLDASKPDTCIASAKFWLRKIKKYAKQLIAANNSASTKVGFPVIMTMCKSDMVKPDDAASLKRAKEIQGQLRALSLQVGAAVIYTSAVGDLNCSQLKKYITHILYPEIILMQLSIEVCVMKTIVKDHRSLSVYRLL
jgi:hypothetical protein